MPDASLQAQLSPPVSDLHRAMDEDPLSRILRDLRIVGVSYGCCRLSAPWGVNFPKDGTARLHFIIEGACWLRVEGQEPMRLDAGDAVLLPKGTTHCLSDTEHGRTTCISDMPVRPIGDRVYRLDGPAAATAVIACCNVRFREPCLNPLLELMPVVVSVAGARSDPTLPALLAAMADEVLDQKIGAATVLSRLADVVITRLIRAWVRDGGREAEGWMAAIHDPKIGRALAAIHQDPANDWSIEALARTAGLSRSMFAERFTRVLGLSPARYVARWRMYLASALLVEQGLSIAEVSGRLGYESGPAFSRAFKRHLGVSPGAMRLRAVGASAEMSAPA
ncbi:AraC family transcriptional regulator [Phenylobacterium sp.]|uniref:AraC family transcriptional regulator n=1 Tax=Phenylobacterium sp. TaxID=1871053 RepID=UPI00289FD7B4|nr:AraC family transcriptional regulator [Phenylobacterium sp.]